MIDINTALMLIGAYLAGAACGAMVFRVVFFRIRRRNRVMDAERRAKAKRQRDHMRYRAMHRAVTG